MMLSRSEAEALLARALSHVEADDAEISLGGGRRGNLRFARNAPSTSGETDRLTLTVTCAFGNRVGAFQTTELDDASLKAAVRRAEEMARLSPENPEYMRPLGPQNYAEVNEWDEATARLSAEERAGMAATAIEGALQRDVVAAGYYENRSGFRATANNRGLFAYHPLTEASYTLTVRTLDGTGSGWAAGRSFRADRVDGRRITDSAIEKALRSHEPQEIEPGKYTVVLESSPVGAMLNLLGWNLDRRSADEGRSYFSASGGGTKVGSRLFGDDITIYSDPAHPVVPASPWGEDGLPHAGTAWIENGVLKNLACSRYWAGEKGIAPLPHGPNLIMNGGDHSLDDLVAATDRGLLITSFWYIRQVDPKSILFTGLTRDGVFLIENGKVTRPVINLRWNESPVTMLKNIEMMTQAESAVTREGNTPLLVPALKVREFTFSSVSRST